MKKWWLIFSFVLLCLLFTAGDAAAQCSICSRTAEQMGERPAKGMNAGIIYLALTPFMITFYLGYRWWKNNKED